MEYNPQIGIIVINIAAILVFITIRFVFKKSIVYTVGVIFLFVIDVIACLAFFVGGNKLVHLFWAVPLSVSMVFLAYYLTAVLVRAPLKILTNNINDISKGNLTLLFDKKITNRNDELGEISNSVESLVIKLNEVLKEINQISAHLSISSNIINTSAEQLSQGASEQAASSEEISSSIEQMVANISQNSQNAVNTEKIAKLSAEGIHNGNKSTHVAIEYIKEISDKILIINDISFQT